MSDTKVICRRSELVAVADATRSKTGRTDEMTLGEIASAITASGGTDTSDATATANEIFAGETAYTADGKVTGTFTIDSELATQDNLIEQLQSIASNLPDAGSGEDVTTETNAYTSKLATLETAVAALESELAGKASGSGSVTLTTGSFTITDNGMHEPGVNAYTLTSDTLCASSRLIIMIMTTDKVHLCFTREQLSDSFTCRTGAGMNTFVTLSKNSTLTSDNTITAYGTIDTNSLNFMAM
jgi:hypothetical protein